MSASTFTLGPAILTLGLTKLVKKSKKIDETNIKIANNWIGVNNWLIEHVLPELTWHISIDDSI